MIRQFYNSFMQTAPLQMPQLLSPANLRNIEDRGDIWLLHFTLPCGYIIDEVVDIIDDNLQMNLLYQSEGNGLAGSGQSAVAYANRQFGQMYKIAVLTGADRVVSELTVTLYESIDIFEADLKQDLAKAAQSGRLKYCQKREDLLANFL